MAVKNCCELLLFHMFYKIWYLCYFAAFILRNHRVKHTLFSVNTVICVGKGCAMVVVVMKIVILSCCTGGMGSMGRDTLCVSEVLVYDGFSYWTKYFCL